MTITPVYLLTIPGNPSIRISLDELRSLLGEIEAELHSSKVYLRAVATSEKLLGASAEQIKILLKAVGREAISLAFQQFAQAEKLTSSNDVCSTVEPEKPSDLNMKVEKETRVTDGKSDLSQDSTVLSGKTPPINSTSAKPRKWFQTYKKPIAAELAKQKAAEQRQEIMYRIGEQLKQAREYRGLSLYQLNVYTHVPINHMEAIENGNFNLLPEDALVRGFIRAMGNALGLNGTKLAASLPASDPMQTVLPSWYNPKKSSGGLVMDVRPIHLYVGYTAVVAGAVGGLSLISQQAKTDRAVNPNMVDSPSSCVSKSSEISEVSVKPGLGSSHVGSDIAPPETF